MRAYLTKLCPKTCTGAKWPKQFLKQKGLSCCSKLLLATHIRVHILQPPAGKITCGATSSTAAGATSIVAEDLALIVCLIKISWPRGGWKLFGEHYWIGVWTPLPTHKLTYFQHHLKIERALYWNSFRLERIIFCGACLCHGSKLYLDDPNFIATIPMKIWPRLYQWICLG